MTDRRLVAALALTVTAATCLARDRDGGATAPPGWQNPDIGLTVDAVVDAHDAGGRWKSPGLTLRGAELIVSGSIDPYAVLTGNALITEGGAELHEAFALFPFLPLNLRAKAGLMLADFGRWNRFHTHAMPFTTEPRIYREYVGGMLGLRGLEVSWMAPIRHYVEVTVSGYDRIRGHSHDSDPSTGDAVVARSVEEIARQIGATRHGDHWHGPDGRILYEKDLLALADQATTDDPVFISGNLGPADFAWGGRVTTTVELGPHVSVDVGTSALYQHRYRESRRIAGVTYPKLLYGADLTLFWHPLTANRYRNLQTGIELLGSYEGTDRRIGGVLFQEYFTSTGAFGWLAWQQSARWSFGGFGEFFQANTPDQDLKSRFGAFATLGITHFQYLRLEASRFQYPGTLDGVNLLRLQYDATIGYHTHGRQR